MIENRTTAYLCFDPRDPAQSLTDRATWRPTCNAILISATMLHATYGENYPISWDKVAALADLCTDLMSEPDIAAATDDALPALATIEETNAMLRMTFAGL